MSTGNQNKTEEIPQSAKETYQLIGKKLQEFYRDRSPIEMADEDAINGVYIKLANKIVDLLELLHVQSVEDEFFWTDCPLSVYVSTIDTRLKYKKQKNREPDLTVEMMLFREYAHFDRITSYTFGQRYLGAQNKDLDQFISLDYQPILNKDRFRPITEKFETARKNKKQYIIDCLHKQGKEIGYENGKYILKNISVAGAPVDSVGDTPIDVFEIPLDLSDSKSSEKIIYLHELGILEHIQKSAGAGSSINGLATVVSAITGIPVGTAQSYLNPILSSGTKQRNNPLKSAKNVTAVNHTLIKLGFKQTK